MRHRRRGAFSDREVVERRPGGDGPSGPGVGDPGDNVHHQFAVVVDGDLDASLGPRLDELVDGLLYQLLRAGHRRQNRHRVWV
jgi:hypothetical protein